jgi:hypothetical protein
MKGNPRNIELVLNSRYSYASPTWRRLQALVPGLFTRRAIVQYVGFVKDRLWRVREALGAPADATTTFAVRKLLYHAMHKLEGLEAVVAGRPPPVALTGAAKDAVMDVRNTDRSLDELRAVEELLTARVRAAEATADSSDLPLEVDPAPFLALLDDVRRR